ncbi:MAG: class I SAM-dependent methyltransferase [Ferruginibacter sp.]
MEFTTQQFPCSSCKRDTTEILLKKQGFNIVQCNHCGFIYVNPRIVNKQLGDIYKHNYFNNKGYGYIGYEQEKRLRAKNFERWLTDAGALIPVNMPINALDVGCAAGYCLDVMKARGWSAEGLELDEEMCINLAKSGYVVFNTLLENFESDHQYQVITLFDVIEHIPDLDVAFKKLNQLIAEDGIVIIVTPNHNSLQRKLFRKRWFQYKPIEHIQYFTPDSLVSFAKRNSFQPVYQHNCGQYADTQFLVNRLSYYHFSFLSKLFNKVFYFFNLKNRFFYTDTGSMLVGFKKK